MHDDLDPVRALLPDTEVHPVERLRGGERSSVVRVRLRTAGSDRTAVVKRFRAAGEGWVRETAALAALPPGVGPDLISADRDTGVVLMSDLGPGPTVADALLGRDPQIASAAACGWAEGLAAVHAAAGPLREKFLDALAAREGDLPVAPSRVSAELADAAIELPERCAAIGVAVPTGAMDELRALGRRLGGDGAASLSPVDTCPDDAVLLDGRYRLVDFEGAQWRHVTWDVAYLTVPWPTCWCSWRLPADVAERAVDAYRRAAAPAFPQVADDGFERDLEAATVGWALTSVTWFLDGALQADSTHHPHRDAPSRRATVLHRLAVASANRELPALGGLAGRLAAELTRRWGAIELPLAPAFRAGR